MASPADGMNLDNDNSRDGAASVASMTPALHQWRPLDEKLHLHHFYHGSEGASHEEINAKDDTLRTARVPDLRARGDEANVKTAPRRAMLQMPATIMRRPMQPPPMLKPRPNFSDLRGALTFYASRDAAPRRFVSSFVSSSSKRHK
jgi:hypothetical protein